MAKQAAADKRQRRERGSINPDDIIKGAFELAEQVGIDNLSMPLLGKHLGVGVTSIYWYFRKKDDLLNAMTDRALRQYVFATPYVEATDWRETLRNHARAMRKTFLGNPILSDLILIRSALPHGRRGWASRKWRRPSPAWSRPGCRRRTRSTPTPRCRCTCGVRWCCNGFTRRTWRPTKDRGTSRRRWSIDTETAPLLALVTRKGHRIGAADDVNFEFGLDCILDHAEPADRTGWAPSKPAKPAKSAGKAGARRGKSAAAS